MSNTYLKLFVDSLERYQKLSDAEFGRLIRAGLIYKATGTVPQLNGREELLFDGMKLDIDRDNEQYTATCAARSEAGRRGAEARWNGNCHNGDGKNGKSHLPYGKNGQDKEEDKDKDKDNIVILTDNLSARTNYADAVNTYNDLCVPPLPAVKQLSETRKQHIKTGLQKLTKAGTDWQGYFTLVNQSDFLMGRTGNWHGCGFDWLVKPANMLKVLEGNYNRLTPEQEQKQREQEELEAWMRSDDL